MGYFGTDGIRGVWGQGFEGEQCFDGEFCFWVGVALARIFGSGEFVVGRDSRTSGGQIFDMLAKGLCCNNSDVRLLDCGIVTTPLVSFLTSNREARCGIMITASHNPPEYNGIKIFDKFGKLDDDKQCQIQSLLQDRALWQQEIDSVGYSCQDIYDGSTDYLDCVVSRIGGRLDGLNVMLDCANGAMGSMATKAFERLGASVVAFNTAFDGCNINNNCGALYPEFLLSKMVDSQCRLGFCFDGDADRLAVIYDGEILDGDTVLYNLCKVVDLSDNTIVGTVLSNNGFETALRACGISLVRTGVGDRNISKVMRESKHSLGGEQSGHYIIAPSLTGDGLMAALTLSSALYKDGVLSSPQRIKLIPQRTVSLPADKTLVHDPKLLHLVKKYDTILQGIGRLLVRYSGTEPKLRVMVECDDLQLVEDIIGEFAKLAK